MDGATQERLGWALGADYPLPIVDWASAAATARERLWALRHQQGFAATAAAIQQRHCSRRSGLRASRRPSGSRSAGGLSSGIEQLGLDLG